MSRLVRAALVASALAATLAGVGWFWARWYVSTDILPGLWSRYGLVITAEQEDVSLFDGSADLRGVRVMDGKRVFLTAERMKFRISPIARYRGRTIVEELLIERGLLRTQLDADGRLGIAKILARRRRDPRRAARPATLWRKVVIKDSAIECDDLARGVTLRFVDLDAEVTELQTGRGARDERFEELLADAKLEQAQAAPAPVAVVAWATSSERLRPSFVGHVVLTGLDLDSFPAHVDQSRRTSLGVDHLDVVLSMDVRQGEIRQGAMVATSPERRRPLTLRFGGPLRDPILDESSKMIALWELPFARLGTLGDVAWETGSAVGGGALGVITELGDGDLAGAGESAAEGVGDTVKALGSNAIDAVQGVGRALGLVRKKEHDPTALHAERREEILAERAAARREWSPGRGLSPLGGSR